MLKIALDFLRLLFHAGGAQDDGHAVGNLELIENFLHPAAVLMVGDLARDAAAVIGVRHQNAVTSREG